MNSLASEPIVQPIEKPKLSADNFGFSMGWTMGSEASEFIRSGPHIQSLEEPDQLGLNSVTLAAPTSNGLSQSALSDRLVRAGLVYGFGTSGFRIGMGYTQLPLENHSYLACNPAGLQAR